MIRQNLLTALIVATCLGVAACSDKAPDIASSPSTTPAPDTVAPAAAAVATSLSDWTGDLATAQKNELCALDAVNGVGAVQGKFETTTNQPVAFEGWISTTNLRRPEQFAIVLDGEADFQVAGGTGVARDDVANAYATKDLANAGYKLELSSLSIPAGEYAVILTHEHDGATMACDTKLVVAAK